MKLVWEDILLPELRKKQIWTREIVKVVVLPSFPLVIHSQLSIKSPLESLIMLFKLFILSMILSSPVTPQTVKNALKERNFALLSSQNDHCSNRLIDKPVLSLLKSMKTGQWRTGKEFCSQITQKSTGLDQMEGCILGREHHFLTGLPHQQSSMEEEITLWYGGAWAGMV